MQPGDVPRTFADISRARAELGYDPQVGVEEGLKRFVAWYRGPEGPGQHFDSTAIQIVEDEAGTQVGARAARTVFREH